MQPAPPPTQQARRSGFPTWAIVLIAVVVAAFVLLPIVAVLGIYSVRRYIANSKTAEARNALGQIAKDAATTYESEKPVAVGSPITHRLCPGASRPVPISLTWVSAKKYQSSVADWNTDCASDRGFCCLKYAMDVPQYYMYSYGATPTTFTAKANGDLNGDGIASTFTIRGEVVGGGLQIAPNIEEIDPGE